MVGRRPPRQGMARVLAAIALALAVAAAGCAELGVVGDGTTVSWGPPNRGVLVGGTRLPVAGEGFVVHPRWAARGTQWGTDELVDVIVHVAREVAAAHPGTRLAVGDLSIAGGGRPQAPPLPPDRARRRSGPVRHGSRGPAGRPRRDAALRRQRARGRRRAGAPLRRRPDLDAGAGADRGAGARRGQHLPLRALRDLVLDHARASGAPDSIVDLAGQVMAQPGDSAPHDDHIHLRLYCAASDPRCHDYAPRPPPKKAGPIGGEEAVAAELARRPLIGSMLHFGPRW
ncbi:MAG: penicillin-insensitive murein endopeptidase [Kofleriaceae bacterium]|nr:penicillin-insensitive murein endopeptidase [Kofleriaceae bacterium]